MDSGGLLLLDNKFFKQYKKQLFRLERPSRIVQRVLSVKNCNNTATSFADHHSVVSKFLFKKIMQLCSNTPSPPSFIIYYNLFEIHPPPYFDYEQPLILALYYSLPSNFGFNLFYMVFVTPLLNFYSFWLSLLCCLSVKSSIFYFIPALWWEAVVNSVVKVTLPGYSTSPQSAHK